MSIVNLGSMNLDHIYTVPHFILGEETLLAENYAESLGGKGLNQSIAVARSGVGIFHAGMLGIGGEALKQCLNENHVNTSLLFPCNAPQGHTVIQINPDGQNCIIVFGGSNQQLNQTHIDQVLDHFQTGDYLLLQNEISNLDYAVESAYKKGLRIVLNASPINAALLNVDFSKLDWLVVNEIECSALSGEADVWTGYHILKARYPSIGILLTLGGDGSISWKNGQELRQFSYPAKVADTTAAGDTFMGYFIGCLTQGYSCQESMRIASAAASIAVSRFGAVDSIPYMSEVLKALK